MIRSIGIALSVLGCCLTATSQYTYFNQLSIESGLEFGNYDTSTNLEVVGDEFILWGGKAIDGVPFLFVRRFDSSGIAIEESTLNFGDSVVYIGGTNSFLSIPNSDDFLFSHAVYSNGLGEGLVMRFSNALDTVWSKTYDHYNPDTYFYTHAPSDNGFIVAGEHVVTDPVGRGTFIMEIDSEGEVLWHTEILDPADGVFRNYSISQYQDKYLVSGSDQNGNNSEGYIEILDEDGNIISHIESSNPGILRGVMRHLINSEGEVIVSQGLSNTWLQPPSLAYNSFLIFKLDVDLQSLQLQNEFLDEVEWLAGYLQKMIEVSDGYVLAGGYREPFAGVNQRKAWIMKIDNDFQQEWYTELSYDNATGNAHYPYDMEQTSDGGYVLVGAYRNSADFYDRTWLVKVDACGDLEWQGCDGPDGLWEQEAILPLDLYPNPSSDFVRVLSPIGVRGSAHWQSLKIIDITGNVVKEITNDHHTMSNSEVEMDVKELPTGLYSIVLRTLEGNIYSEKLIVE